MESTKSITKEFECRKHLGEKIQRVSAIDASNVLYCIDCVLAIENKETKEAVIPIKDFIQRTVAYFEKIQLQGKTLKGDPPKELLAALDGEDEIISKLSSHIEAEKFKVEICFGEILQAFTNLCNKTKQEILVNLDNQLLNLRYNYRYYKGRINKYYGKQTEDEISELTTERGIYSSINKCESSADLEYLVRQINDEINENKVLDSLGNRVEGMSNVLKELKTSLKIQGELLPRTPFLDPMQSQETIEKLQKAVTEFLEDASAFENQIFKFSSSGGIFPTLDSKILKTQNDIHMIQKFLSPNPSSITFKLLFRGTRDGFDANTFHKLCDNKKNTLALIKTSLGKVCGGFTEQTWNTTGTHKEDKNAFLFSVDRKMKFPVKSPNMAIYAHAGYMTTFGGGHDLYLAANCNTHQSNYSNLGHSYDASKLSSNDSKNALGGAYQFKVEEYEVFEVQGYKSK